MTIKNFKRVLVYVVCATLFVVIPSCSQVFAADTSSATNKIRAYQARSCYNEATSSVTMGEYQYTGGLDTLFGFGIGNVILPSMTSGQERYTNCADFLNSYYSSQFSNVTTVSEFDNLMYKLGYKKDGEPTDYSATVQIPFSTGTLAIECTGLSSDGKFVAKQTYCGVTSGGSDSPVEIKYNKSKETFTLTTCTSSTCKKDDKVEITYTANNNDTAATALNGLFGQLTIGQGYCQKNKAETCNTTYSGGIQSNTQTAIGEYTYVKDTGGGGADRFQAYVTGVSGGSSALKLSAAEREALAWNYLQNFYHIEYYNNDENCNLTAEQQNNAKNAGYQAVNLGKTETCYVRQGGGVDHGGIPGWDKNGNPTGLNMGFNDLIEVVGNAVTENQNEGKEKCRSDANSRLKELNDALKTASDANDRNAIEAGIKTINQMLSSGSLWTTNASGVITCNPLPTASGGSSAGNTAYDPSDRDDAISNPNDPGNVDDGTNVCFASAGVLGWIVCPVLQALGKAVDGLYKNVVEDFIQIEAEYMTSDGSAHQAWTTFRNFANLIFAAAFVIVILSQITGIGLSNYNIKKMLPRLIVVVIMVNASFFLCQVAVDLSNILGYSLERFFSNLANGFEEASMSVAGIASGIIGTLFGGAAIIGGVAVAAATWEFWLIPLIIAFVSAIIGIIFFFIVLAVRKAGVLLLVALTPVAIACYALPNTKSLFDKWQKAFIGLLVAYPICGMLMGGGKWLSALLLSQNSNDNGENVFMKLVAMLLQVVPFFFIPGIIRGSLTAMGNIGNRISGFGNNFSRQAANSFRRSELARDMQHGIDRAAYDSVGALGRSRAGQFIANSRLGKFVGGTRIGKWAGDRHATRQAVRKSRLAGRYNFIEKERMKAAASTGNQLLRPGSEAYDNEMRNLTKAQQKLDIASQEARYNDGVGLDKDPASIGEDESWFDVNDDSSKAREYGIQLRQLQKDIASGADYTKTLNNVKALQNIMSKTDAGRSAIQNQLLKMISGQITDGSLAADGKESALSLAAAHLNGEHANTIKQSNRGLSKMVQDLAGKKYSNFSSNDIIATDLGGDADKFGQRNIEYHSKTYSAKGIDGYNAESLANADDGALDRMIRGLQNNEFEGKDVQTLASLANEALIANEKGELQIKEENKNRLRNIIRGAYSANAVAQSQIGAGGTTTTTAGSNALNGASANALHSLAAQIRNGNVTGIEASKIVSNLTAAAKDSSVTHNESWVDAANEVMAAANAKNIKQIDRIDQVNNTEQVTLSGNDVADHVDAANVRFEQDYTPVQIDPTLSTATANDVRAAVEQAKAQFDANHQNHSIATNADIQAALNLARISNPNATVNDLAFKVGDVIEKVTNTNGVTHYHTVSSAVADDFRAGPKKTADFGVGDVIRTDNTSGTPVYTRVSDAEAADYHARNKHNSEVKIQQERRQHKNQPQPSPSPSPTATP